MRLILALLFLVPHLTFGQYGNEWIRYDQAYYKVKVAKDGFYRIAQTDLIAAGLPAGTDPRDFQLFHRGIEQAILVNGESDGTFHSGDYIEFYGRRNDGSTDASLYSNPGDQPHRLYHLFSDTTTYFLTVGPGRGKRIPSVDHSDASLTASSFHWNDVLQIRTDQYGGGRDYGNVTLTKFDQGEGWTGVQVSQGGQINYSINGLTNGVTTGPKPRLELVITGRGPTDHLCEILSGTRLVASVTVRGYETVRIAQPLEWSDIDASGTLALSFRVLGIGGNVARASVGYIRVQYPQSTSMAGTSEKVFSIETNTITRLDIPDAPAGARAYDITDPSSIIDLPLQSGRVYASSTNQSRIFVSSVFTNVAPVRVVFESYSQPNDYLIITHPTLRKAGGNYTDPVEAYASYRSSDAGGNHVVMVADILQLYDQFNYGEASPAAIYQFIRFLQTRSLPRHLFLIGKGLTVNYRYHRDPNQRNLVFKDLVPTAGMPGSDMLFSAGLSGISHVAAVATGRLSANTPADVAAYLDKVKETESSPYTDLRRKNILHLSGGIEDHEPPLFRQILSDVAPAARSFYAGAHVDALAKQSTGLRFINIADEVNKGLALVTFFGHSAPTTQDFDIGYVSSAVLGYNNPGKYPVLLMNGCDAGALFLNTQVTGENWVLTPKKGAIAFIAHSAFGFVSTLQQYTNIFYEVNFSDSLFVNAGLGAVQNELGRRFLSRFGDAEFSISQVQQMTLQGDPAVKLFGAEKPDFDISEERIFISSTDGAPITSKSDSLRLSFVLNNYGKAINRRVRVEVTRRLSDNSTLVYDSIFTPVLYSDTVFMTLPNGDKSFGNNTFSVTVDADGFIDELDESNNVTSLNFFIPSNGTKNLYPDDFGIVHVQNPVLSFQHTDMLADNREFILEIDSVVDFNSPFKKTYRLQARVLGQKQVELASTDTTAYYWRTRLAEPRAGESDSWFTSSFTYIHGGPEGWAQVRFPQFTANTLEGLVADATAQRFGYPETAVDIEVRTFPAAAGKPRDSVSVKVNGLEYNLYLELGGAFGCRLNTINLMAFDKVSTQPYAGIMFKWYELLYQYGGRRLLCGREPYAINSFTPTELVTGNNDDLIRYIDNIQEGDTVLLFNIGNAGFSQWPPAAKAKLLLLGISPDQFDQLVDGEAVVIFGRKGGAPGSALVQRGGGTAKLDVRKVLKGRFASGKMTSVVIGPASKWKKFTALTREVEAQDRYVYSIVGIKPGVRQDTVKINITSTEDLTSIRGEEYPYLKLVIRHSDPLNLTPPQVSNWIVEYDPVPEGFLFFDGAAARTDLPEGMPWTGQYGFVNISDQSFSDSLNVLVQSINQQSQIRSSTSFRIKQPLPGDTVVFNATVNTIGKQGLNDVEVFVNPYVQPELDYDNNALLLPGQLNILKDVAAPVLEVSFDGRTISNGEVVAPNPEIAITLWDNNPYFRISDTTAVRVFIAKDCPEEGCSFAPVYFRNSEVRWESAAAGNPFRVWYTPTLSSGTYVLRVEARDASGNNAGEQPYEITFIVDEAQRVHISKAFPNPAVVDIGVRIVSGGGLIPEAATLRVVDVRGIAVKTQRYESSYFNGATNDIRWSNEGLRPGIYFYEIEVVVGENRIRTNGKYIVRTF